MEFRHFLESTSKNLVIVDIQPQYAQNINFMGEFPNFVSQYQSILNCYVGQAHGLSKDTKQTIAKWYYKNGVPKDVIYRMKWFDKGYAFFRDIMDSDKCFMRDDIVKIIRYMIKKKVNDSRQLSKRDVLNLKIPDFIYKELEDMPIYIPELRWYINKWNGADICGGGFNECYEEVLLLADALNLKFNPVQQFIYGKT